MSSPGAARFSAISRLPYSKSAAAGRGAAVARLAEIAIVVVERRVGPGEQLVAIRLRHAEQARDRLQRQLGGDVEEEVARAARRDRVEDRRACARAARLRAPRARAATAGVSRAGGAPVARVVHHVEQHARRRSRAAGPRSACRRRRARRRLRTRSVAASRAPRRRRRSATAPRSPRRPACARVGGWNQTGASRAQAA